MNLKWISILFLNFWLSTQISYGISLPKKWVDQLIDINKGSTASYISRSGDLKMTDGTLLSYTSFTPRRASAEKKPGVILISPWGWPGEVYLLSDIPQTLAEAGFVVMMYTARGFWDSQGLVDLAGAKDLADLKKVVDWMTDNLPIDSTKLGTSGISFGAGLALISLAKEPRIKTAVALSSWAHLFEGGLFYGGAFHNRALQELLATEGGPGDRKRGIDSIKQRVDDYVQGIRKAETDEWANLRSPTRQLEEMNRRLDASSYILHTYGDQLFNPNSLLELHQGLRIPKKVEFIAGTHGVSQLLDPILQSGVKDRVVRWFQERLMTQVPVSDEVLVEVRSPLRQRSKAKKKDRQMESFAEFPPQNSQTHRWYLRTQDGRSKLLRTPPQSVEIKTLYAGEGAVIFEGQDLKSEFILEALTGRLVTEKLKTLNKPGVLWFESAPFGEVMKIRGVPKLTVHVDSEEDSSLLVAYLFDLDPQGVLNYVSTGTKAVRSSGEPVLVNLKLQLSAYDIQVGHRLVLAFESQKRGVSPQTTEGQEINLIQSPSAPSVLSIEMIP